MTAGNNHIRAGESRINILWDFDGTLFNTYPAYAAVFNRVLGGNVPEDEIMRHLRHSFSHAADYYKLTDSMLEHIFALEEQLSPDQTPPFPYVEQVLMKSDTNVIMTHKHRRHVDIILDYYGWNRYFVEIVAGDDGFPRKPDPQSYIYLHRKYHIDLIVGDREIDILAGKQLGIKTCLFQNNTAGADCYLSDYRDFFQTVTR